MEELTKHQLILLALLVSFVTSIATGIVTVSLVDQVPRSFTQTINRVVERTVERVVPATTNQQVSVITKEVTVVVSEDDLVTESIGVVLKSVLPIYQVTPEGDDVFVRYGTAISQNTLVTSGLKIRSDAHYLVQLPNGTKKDLMVISDVDAGTAFLSLMNTATTTKNVFTSVSYISPESLKRGQSVIALGGNERNAISTGIVSDLFITKTGDVEGAPKESSITGFAVTLNPAPSIVGGPIFTQFGELIGLYTEEKDGFFMVKPATDIQNELQTILEADDKEDIDG